MDVAVLTKIALGVIAPVIVMAGVGFLLGWRRLIEPEPIARLYLMVFVPALAFVNVVDASLSGEQLGQVVGFCFLSVVALMVLSRLGSAVLKHDRGMRGAFANSIILYNSANYGLPVQKLAFPKLSDVGPTSGMHGAAIQPIVLITQSFVAFTLGAFNAASNSPGFLATLKQVFRMPLTWALLVGAAFHLSGITTGDIREHAPMLWYPIDYFQKALVPVALLSLGVQLASVRLRGKVLNLALACGLRLLVAPLLGLGVGLLLGIHGPLLAILVVSISFPTAVFSSVLATDFRNHADYAAAAVFLSTVLSIVTVTVVIYLSQVYLL